MTVLTSPNAKLIEELISQGHYQKATEEIFDFIDGDIDVELKYKSLTLLNRICDKSPSIALKVIKKMDDFINDSNSWIRLVSLEIIYQISMYRPNLLISLIEKIKARLFDKDASVRRLSVKIVGTLILSLHLDKNKMHDLIDDFTEKLMDNDWKVKLNVIKILQKIINQDYSKLRDLEPLFSIIILNLRDEDEDVARSAAELLNILGTYFLSKDKVFYVLLNLLYNEENRVKELIIWLFGEIGKEKSSEIIPIIPKLINLLEIDDYRIQLKIIDALVKIAHNNFDQIWANLINTLLEANEKDFKTNLTHALFHICQENISIIFSYIFEELENPSKNVRDAIALVFRRLFEEFQIDIENEITKFLYKLDSKFWRERKKTILLLNKICFILKNEKIAIWITIELEKALKSEKDADVNDVIISALHSIRENYPNIKTKIEDINNELTIIQEKITSFQKIPAQFREDLNKNIKNFKFNTTEIELNKRYNQIIGEINNFHRDLNNFGYKRLAFDLIEDWEETKIQIIEELSLIKSFISEIFNERKSEFIENLNEKIKLLQDRVNILEVKFDYIKDFKLELDIDKIFSDSEINKEIEEKFSYITQLRKNLFKLDGDIRELLINNLEFTNLFKKILRKWISTKIKIQEYFSEIDNQVKILKNEIISSISNEEDFSNKPEYKHFIEVRNKFAYQILQSHVQELISQSIDEFKKMNDNFPQLNSKLDYVVKKKEFSKAYQLLEVDSNQIHVFIEEIEKSIEDVLGKDVIIEDNNLFDLYVRPYLNRWNASKELLINKLANFVKKNQNNILLHQIKHYLDLINPISLDLLSSYVNVEKNHLKTIIINFINRSKLNAKIIGESVISPKLSTEIKSTELLFYKDIKTIGNKIYMNLKLSNPTTFNFNDIQISLKLPSYIKFLKKESFPRILYLNELKQSDNFKFKYILKIDKNIKRDLISPNADEIKLDLYYKDPYNISRKTSKRLNLLLP